MTYNIKRVGDKSPLSNWIKQPFFEKSKRVTVFLRRKF